MQVNRLVHVGMAQKWSILKAAVLEAKNDNGFVGQRAIWTIPQPPQLSTVWEAATVALLGVYYSINR